MFNYARITTVVATLWLLLFCVQANSFELFPAEPQEAGADHLAADTWTDQAENSHEEFSEYSAETAQDAALMPTIEITGDAFVSSIPSTSWSAGVELVAFHTDYEVADFREGGEDKYVASPRVYLGWESKSGFGIRSRYWDYKNEGLVVPVDLDVNRHLISSPGVDPHLVVSVENIPFTLSSRSLDIDFYKRFSTGPTDVVLGAGLRGAGLNFGTKFSESTISTIGASLFSDFRHRFYQTEKGELAFVASGRVAWLTGESDSNHPSYDGITDANMTTTEAALGLEWKRDLGWSVLTLRAQYETQLWDSNIASDVAFNGGVIRTGFSW